MKINEEMLFAIVDLYWKCDSYKFTEAQAPLVKLGQYKNTSDQKKTSLVRWNVVTLSSTLI